MSLTGYVQSVRRALGGRADEYREFVDVIADLRRSAAAAEDDDETVISQIERAVSLLDGQPELIAGLRVFLPPQYYIDIQPDAVIIKVRYPTPQRVHCLSDSPHSESIQSPADQVYLLPIPPERKFQNLKG